MSSPSQYRVTCEDCPGYELDRRYSRQAATWEANFHDELIHQDGQQHARVGEVDT